MTPATSTARTARFGPYEVDVRSGEVRKFGTRLKVGEQPLRILVLLMEHPGELVTREELRTSLWSDDTFVDFDHSLNSAVQRLRESLSDTADKEQWIETVPRRGYRFVGAVQWAKPNGSAPALMKCPEPSAREPRAENTIQEKAGSQPADWLRFDWRLVAAALALLLTAGAIVEVVHRERVAKPAIAIRSLAVLPLENLSGDPSQDFFADGMTDELITMLAKNTSLRVISRTSVMQHKKVHRPIRDIARELGVDGILEGSVIRSSNRVHMTVQLIHAPTDTHMWAESYDRDLSDVASLQSELALTVARQVGLNASAATAVSRRINPVAHDAYLLGRYCWFAGQYEMSKEYFEKAIAIEPDYAAAWSGVADYYVAKAAGGEAPPEALIPRGEAAARKAVALDDSSAEAHNSLAAAYYFGRWDWNAAERESARAVELNPHYAEAHHVRSYVLSTLNRGEEALQQQKTAMEIDPFARPWALGTALIRARQFDAAITELRARTQAQPNDASVRETLSLALWLAGREDEAAAELEDGYTLAGQQEDEAAIRAAFRRNGFKAVLEWRMNSLKKEAARGYVSPVELAAYSARLHRTDETLRYLERGYQERATQMVRVSDDPVYDFLRSDPRFQAILRSMRLTVTQ